MFEHIEACMCGLTAGDSVPRAAIDDVAVRLEVLVVAHAAVGVGHRQVGGGIDGGQPAEEGVVRRRRVLLGGPVPGAVEGVGDHQLPAVEVGAEHKGDVLHPADDSTGLWGDLTGGWMGSCVISHSFNQHSAKCGTSATCQLLVSNK